MKGSFMYKDLLKYIVEFLGTLFFLHMILLSEGNSLKFVALIVGGALSLMIFLLSPYSGGHFNPAVTIMMAFSNETPWSDVLPYIMSQIAGEIVAIQLNKFRLSIISNNKK